VHHVTKSWLLIIAVALLSASAAVKADRNASGSPKQAGNPPNQEKTPAIAAIVNTQKITTAELDERVEQIMRRSAMDHQQEPPPDRDKLRHRVLDILIAEKLMLQDAAKKKIFIPADKVEAELSRLKGEGQSDAEFEALVRQSGTTLPALRNALRESLTIDAYIEREIAPKVQVDDKQIAAFYEGNPRYFETPEQVHARHILIMVKQGSTEEEKKNAEARANELLQRVEKGEDFAQLAMANSDDPGTKENGGDLGFFPRGVMVPEFEEAAFALEPGQTSKVIRTEYGFHIIRCEEKKPAGKMPLSEVSARIGQYLREQEISRLLGDRITALRKAANVKVNLPE